VQRMRKKGPMQSDTQSAEAQKAASAAPAAATSPPEEAPPASVLAQWKARASAGASAVLMPVVRRAGRAYVGGDTVHDALTIARRLNQDGLPNTLGFWDTVEYTPEQVAEIYVDAVKELAGSGLDTYLSIKPPALRYDPAFTAQVAAAAKKWNVRVHCDSHGPETADQSHALEQALLSELPATHVSTTLPGRWLRSLPDADWAVERGIRVRVVKGQWPDPEAPNRDFSEGYLEVIDRLAGRAREVGVATHDVPLTEKVVAKLRAAKTPFELELLYGMPMEKSLRWAKDNKVPVRVYVPFGKGFLPSAVGVLRRNPRLAWLVIKDFLTPSAVRIL
jgi:proline dehydrogenase